MDTKMMLFLKREENNYIIDVELGQVFRLYEQLSDQCNDYYVDLDTDSRQEFINKLIKDSVFEKEKDFTGVLAVLFNGGVCRDDYQDKD